MGVQSTYSQNASAAIEGQLTGSGSVDIDTKYNGEASAEIGFGRAVKFGATDDAAILPAAETDKICGIVVHSHAYAKTDELGTTGLKPGVAMNILRRGEIWAVCEDGCVPGDRLWVRAVGSTPPEYLGGLNSADDGTDMVDCTNQGVWMSTASAGGLAKLQVDFTGDAT